jgi:putative intracellular protease/amidase
MKLKEILIGFLLIVPQWFAISVNAQQNVNVLAIFADNYGPNSYFNLHYYSEYGWNVTTTAITPSVQICEYYDIPDYQVDTLIDQITDVSAYDAIFIQPSEYVGENTCIDLINSTPTLELLQQANNLSIPIWATCSGVRVLAAADILEGVQIQGRTEFMDEYDSAGAVFVGDHILPVIDGNIITTMRGQFYQTYNCEVAEDVIEQYHQTKINGEQYVSDFKTTDLVVQNSLITEWNRTYGDEFAQGIYRILNTGDNGYVYCGYTYSDGNKDALIGKVDLDGNPIFAENIGLSGREVANSIALTSDEGYIITGYTTSSLSQKNVFVAKADINGNVDWMNNYGGDLADEGLGIIQTSDGGYLVAGYTFSNSLGESDVYVLKLDATGSVEWSDNYGGELYERAYDCMEVEDGYLVVGGTESFGAGNMDVYLIKLDFDGNLEWQQTFGGGGINYEKGVQMILTQDDHILIQGLKTTAKYFVVKSDLEGNLVWNKTYGDATMHDMPGGIAECENGDILLTGCEFNAENQKQDAFFLRTNKDGIVKWEQYVELEGVDKLNSILSDGNYIVAAGYTNSDGAGSFDNWILKIEEPFYVDFFANKSGGLDPVTVEFTDMSSGQVEYWEWDFDDDGWIDSNERNPTFTYTEPGIFDVKLIVSNGVETDTLVKENLIRVISNDIEEVEKREQIIIYPNPVSESTVIEVNIKEESELSIYDQLGNIINQRTLKSGIYYYPLALLTANELKTGIYFVCLRNGAIYESKKFIVNE